MSAIEATNDGCRLQVQVVPRASRTQLGGIHGDALKLKVAAPPVEGAANEEVIRFLARRLGVRRDAVGIVSGATGRRKVVVVQGVTALQAARELEGG